ncbi:MAG: Na+/H+ antiporter NhaC [Rikenellaceae bacterium]
MENRSVKQPNLFEALLPIIILMVSISLNVAWIGDDTLSGANQLSLLIASGIAVVIAVKNGHKWDEIMESITKSITSALSAITILFIIGMLSGAWMAGGIVPTMIYYGLEILHPSFFLPAVVVICSIISVAVGSSWSTVATIGIALLGIGKALGFDEAIIAGAIISGAYFGDKISPLSDTTNLAAAVAQTPIFTHIRYMLYTTIPSITITILIFIGITIWGDNLSSEVNVSEMQNIISETYKVSPWFLIVPLLTFVMIVKKMPAIPVLFIGSIMGIVCVIFFQQDFIRHIAGTEILDFKVMFTNCSRILYTSTDVTTGNEAVDSLFSTGGMAGMLNTVWLIITAMVLGGVLEANNALNKIMYLIKQRVSKTFGIVGATTGTAIFFNLTTGDQYISIVVPSRMFTNLFKKADLRPEVLSRTIEDSATVTSVLIPWNTCGATQASVLGVSTWIYAPFAFFCYISPIMTLIFAALNYKIRKISEFEELETDETVGVVEVEDAMKE